MKIRAAVGCFAAVLMTGPSFAADVPVTSLYRPAPYIVQQQVEWTGIYFGVNAGYGWAQHTSNVRFVGNPNFSGFTDPISFFGIAIPGPTELSGVNLANTTNLNGGLAGGQIGFNWQAGKVVFGAELDGQWSGQQGSFLVNCGAGCTAAENVKMRSLLTGRGRIGLAFDWILPYVTGGVALVNGIDNLTVTVGGVTANFAPLSASVLGWTAGAGVEVALWSNWSAKLEYLYVSANGINTTTVIPSALGAGFATTPMEYRDNIVRVGLNYRFGPRGGPGVLEASTAPRETYATSYDVLPDVRPYQAKGSDRSLAASKIATHDPGEIQTAPPVQTAPRVQTASPAETAPIASGSKQAGALKQASALNQADVIPRSFADIGDIDDTDALAAQPKQSVSKKRREKEDDENLRMKRIMSICTGC